MSKKYVCTSFHQKMKKKKFVPLSSYILQQKQRKLLTVIEHTHCLSFFTLRKSQKKKEIENFSTLLILVTMYFPKNDVWHTQYFPRVWKRVLIGRWIWWFSSHFSRFSMNKYIWSKIFLSYGWLEQNQRQCLKIIKFYVSMITVSDEKRLIQNFCYISTSKYKHRM